MTPQEVRELVDAITPRTLPDGSINARHVAIESTLREQHGLPSYVAELDGPGRFRPTCPPHDPEGGYPYPCRRCGAPLPTF